MKIDADHSYSAHRLIPVSSPLRYTRGRPLRWATAGFTLIELLIAIALMLILTLVLTQIFNATVGIFSRAQQQVQIYSNEKAFVELLTRELSNFLPISASGSTENAMRIYSPTEQMSGAATDDFPNKNGGSTLCRYSRSYYAWDENYQTGYGNSYPDEIDFDGGDLPYEPETGGAETYWSAPLLAFGTNTTFVFGGQRVIGPAWVEYFLAKARVNIDGIERTFYYLKRRLLRLQAAMPGDQQYVMAGHGALGVEAERVEPFVERPWREELYTDPVTGRGSMDGEVVLEFFPRIDKSSQDFEDIGDAFKIEFYVYDQAAKNGTGGFAWVRPDEDFGEAVFMASPDNPLNGISSTSTLPRPPRTLTTAGETANFYPSDLKSPPAPGGGQLLYDMDTPLAIRITAMLAHDRSDPQLGNDSVAREDYADDDVPPRTFQHVFWLPAAPASLRTQ